MLTDFARNWCAVSRIN